MEKWIAAFLQLMAALLFFVMGAEGDEALLLIIPAVASGVSGLLLWNRGRTAPALAAPKEEPRPIEAKVDRIEDTLTALQGEIAQLREDRDFYRELYGAGAHRGELKG
jgi:hypothetical protein